MSGSPSQRSRSPKPTVRKKSSTLRYRLLLLILFCLLWICRGIHRRAENSGLSVRNPGETKEISTMPSKDEAPGRNPPSKTFGDINNSPPSWTIAAILPVTSSSLRHLSESLFGLSTISHLSEVHLLCQQNVTNGARYSLRRTLSHTPGFDHTEFFVTPWLQEWSEAESTLRVASGIQSDGILILPRGGLATIDSLFQDTLLSARPPLPVPLGLRGSGVSCETKYRGFFTADFVLPPLLLPSRPEAANQSYFHLTSWQELGAHFSRVEGVGGIVLPETLEGTSGCPGVDTSEAVVPNLERPDLPSDSSESDDLLVILAAEKEEIPALSRLACKFRFRGTEVKIIAYRTSPDHAHPFDPPDGGCDILYTQVQGLKDPTLRQLLDRSQVVFLTLVEYHLPLESLLEVNARATVIRLPRRDLPHCYWIASLSVHELRNWHVPRIDISVVTNDRPDSLLRLLQSLSNSRYFGDELNIRINVEQEADYETLNLISHWNWEHGSTFITKRVIHAGLLPAIAESWYPHSNNSYGLILEDDVEVSPLFYSWLKMNLLRYRYGDAQNLSPRMFGISLYQPKVIETRLKGREFFNPRTLFAANDITEYTTPYLSQIPCSWGALYFPEHWREFHSYLNVRFSEALFAIDAIVVPDARSNRWPKSWKKYFIELAYLRGYVMVYPNYDNFVSLSTNHFEIGSHVKNTSRESYAKKREMFRVPVMGLEGPAGLMDLPNGTLPGFNDLPVLDLFGQLSSLEDLIQLGQTRQSEVVPNCEPSFENHVRPDFRALICVPHNRIN